MTTSVTIWNHGPHRININEVEPVLGAGGEREHTVEAHTIESGATVTLNVWGRNHYLCILETDDTNEA